MRNSWGKGWGIDGYIHLSREADNKTFVDKHPADGVACKPLPRRRRSVVSAACSSTRRTRRASPPRELRTPCESH